MKHFLDIETIRLKNDEFKLNNVEAFEKGDHIVIQEKVDGANSSVSWNNETLSLEACSRKRILTFDNTLNGFWNYVQSFSKATIDWFRDNSQYVVFGEWNLNCNKIKSYRKEFLKTWIVYDIYNSNTRRYMPQDFVKSVCEKLHFEYIHVLYEGSFIDWEHVKSFLNKKTYGDIQEGVVIKNMTKLADAECRMPSYLKIVNTAFKERMSKNRVKKEKSADELFEEARVQTIVDTIVTPARVEKAIYKLRDEGVFPEKLVPKDMGLVAKNLPRFVYQDLLKEESEMVKSGGELFGKKSNSKVMELAKQIILG